MQKNSKLTTGEQEILLRVGFHEDRALRRLIIELRRTFGIEQREVFGALDFANNQGLDVKFYLSSLREREKTLTAQLNTRLRNIAFIA